MDSVYLSGSESVERGGFAAKSGGEDMLRAANIIDDSLRQQRQFLDEWLNRFEQILKEALADELSEAPETEHATKALADWREVAPTAPESPGT